MTGDRRSPTRESGLMTGVSCIVISYWFLVVGYRRQPVRKPLGDLTRWMCAGLPAPGDYPQRSSPPTRAARPSSTRGGLATPAPWRFRGKEYPSFQFRWCRTVRSRLSIIWTVGGERCGKGYLAGIARRGVRCGGGAVEPIVREGDESRSCCAFLPLLCSSFRSLLYWISSDRSEASECARCSFFFPLLPSSWMTWNGPETRKNGVAEARTAFLEARNSGLCDRPPLRYLLLSEQEVLRREERGLRICRLWHCLAWAFFFPLLERSKLRRKENRQEFTKFNKPNQSLVSSKLQQQIGLLFCECELFCSWSFLWPEMLEIDRSRKFYLYCAGRQQ